MDLNAPATKGDIAELRSEMFGGFDTGIAQVRADMGQDFAQVRADMGQDFAQLRADMAENTAQLHSEMSHIYHDLVERMDDTKTELLRAFYAYATGNDKRIGQIEGNAAAVQSRLATIEGRLLEVEKRLNIPPAA